MPVHSIRKKAAKRRVSVDSGESASAGAVIALAAKKAAHAAGKKAIRRQAVRKKISRSAAAGKKVSLRKVS